MMHGGSPTGADLIAAQLTANCKARKLGMTVVRVGG
ncbi:hypothetical protein [Aureimonas sp. AU12]